MKRAFCPLPKKGDKPLVSCKTDVYLGNVSPNTGRPLLRANSERVLL